MPTESLLWREDWIRAMTPVAILEKEVFLGVLGTGSLVSKDTVPWHLLRKACVELVWFYLSKNYVSGSVLNWEGKGVQSCYSACPFMCIPVSKAALNRELTPSSESNCFQLLKDISPTPALPFYEVETSKGSFFPLM